MPRIKVFLTDEEVALCKEAARLERKQAKLRGEPYDSKATWHGKAQDAVSEGLEDLLCRLDDERRLAGEGR